MRYLLDTNILVYAIMDQDMLDNNVKAIIEDYDNQLCMSIESARELIVAYRNKRLGSKVWKSSHKMIEEIVDVFNIQILPLKKEHMMTYAHMNINEGYTHY